MVTDGALRESLRESFIRNNVHKRILPSFPRRTFVGETEIKPKVDRRNPPPRGWIPTIKVPK